MYNFALMSSKDRDFVFNAVAINKRLTNAIVEKDFWVCLMLDYLFNKSKYKNMLIFKGGTSLSKSFHLINRFSEDIDLILNWKYLVEDENEPFLERSHTQQDTYNKKLNEKAGEFVEKEILPDLQTGLSNLLKINVDIRIDKDDKQVINFYYPKLYPADSILQFIKLEIGPLAELSPAEITKITPYVSEVMPIAFEKQSTQVLTVLPERTFWEKATILHREANRPQEKTMPQRYSRHYYDLYMMAHSMYKEKALNNSDLLTSVINFKNRFYRDNWANYEEILNKNLKLIPPAFRISELEKDYKQMQEMIFDEAPSFTEILDYLKVLELEVNNKDKE